MFVCLFAFCANKTNTWEKTRHYIGVAKKSYKNGENEPLVRLFKPQELACITNHVYSNRKFCFISVSSAKLYEKVHR